MSTESREFLRVVTSEPFVPQVDAVDTLRTGSINLEFKDCYRAEKHQTCIPVYRAGVQGTR
jgi:hypothetical protein